MYYILILHGLAIILLLAVLVLLIVVLILLRRDTQKKDQLNIQNGKEDAFIITIHDLSTLLTSMSYYTDMISKREYGSLKVAQIELLHRIETSLVQAEFLCKKLHKPFLYKTIRKKYTQSKPTKKRK